MQQYKSAYDLRTGKKKERKISKEEYLYAAEPPPMKLTSQTSLKSSLYTAPPGQAEDSVVI